MKARYLVAGLIAGVILGFIIGYRLGSRATQRDLDRVGAQILAELGPIDTNRPVNMVVAIAQVRKEAQTRGMQLASVAARDPHTIQFQVAGGPEVTMRWRHMGEDNPTSWSDLRRKFTHLTMTLESTGAAKAHVTQVDLTE